MEIKEKILNELIDNNKNISYEVAELALQLSENDTKKAQSLISNKIICIKGKILSLNKNYRGAFFIRIFLYNNFINSFFMFTTSENLLTLDLNQSWEEFCSFLNEQFLLLEETFFYLKDRLNKKIVGNKNLQKEIKLFKEKNKEKKIIECIKNIILKELKKDEIKLEIQSDIITQAEHEKFIKKIYKTEDKKEDLSNYGVMIKTEPIILKKSETHKSLNIGDSVYVKIVENSSTANYIRNSLNIKNEYLSLTKDEFLARIFSVDVDDKMNTSLYVELLPGVTSKIIVENNCILKTKHKLTYLLKQNIILLLVIFFILSIMIFYVKLVIK